MRRADFPPFAFLARMTGPALARQVPAFARIFSRRAVAARAHFDGSVFDQVQQQARRRSDRFGRRQRPAPSIARSCEKAHPDSGTQCALPVWTSQVAMGVDALLFMACRTVLVAGHPHQARPIAQAFNRVDGSVEGSCTFSAAQHGNNWSCGRPKLLE